MKKVVLFIIYFITTIAVLASCNSEQNEEPISQEITEEDYIQMLFDRCKFTGMDPDDNSSLDDYLRKISTDSLIKDTVVPSEIIDSIGYLKVFRRNNKIGFSDEFGQIVLDAEFDNYSSYCKNRRIERTFVAKDSLFGMINRKGRLVLPVKYKFIRIDDEDSIITVIDTCGIINNFNVSKCQLINNHNPYNLKIFIEDPKRLLWGIDCERIDPSIKYCLSTSKGEPISDKFDAICPFKSGRALAKRGDAVGFFDTTWHFIEDLKLRNCFFYKRYGSHYVIERKNKYGLLDEDCRMLIPLKYQNLSFCVDSFFIAKKNGKYGIITSKEKKITPFIYDQIYYIQDSHAPDTEALGSCYIPEYIFPYSFIVKKGNKYGVVLFRNNSVSYDTIAYDYMDVKYLRKGNGGTITIYSNGNFLGHTLCWDGYRLISVLGINAEVNGKKYVLSTWGYRMTEGEIIDDYGGVFKKGDRYGMIYFQRILFPAEYVSIRAKGNNSFELITEDGKKEIKRQPGYRIIKR